MATTIARLQTVTNRLGRYQLRYRIALGGMGGVYLAKAAGAGGADKVVAVKLLHEHLAADEAVVSMFLDEARIVSAINHVNVSTVFDFGQQDDLYFLVMEYLEGEPLDRVLKSMVAGTDRHPLHPWLIARVLADSAEGLHAAHELRNADGVPLDVVHRDVSPHNLFVTYDGVAKVVDFGIARARERSTATDAGQFKGKFEYAAPEQIRAKNVDRRADVWALGVCLWELLTCKRLFQREDPTATGRAVLADPIAPPSSVSDFVPPVFDQIAMKALDRDPTRRFQTTREFGRALREALAHSGEVVDQPLVGEWLEEFFPGDRARRQALVAAVRRSGPDSPLESVPSELRIKGVNTGTGSRSYRSGSGSGRALGSHGGRTISERAAALPSEPVRAAVELERDRGTAVKVELPPEPPPSPSRLPLIAGAATLVGLMVAGTIFALTRQPTVSVPEAVAPATVPAKVTPPMLPTSPVGEAAGADEPEVIDAGASPTIAGAEAASDAGLPEADAGRSEPRVADAPRARPPLPPPGPKAKPTPVAAPVVKGKGDGRVRFKTPGATAEVLVNGKVVGTTPLTLDLPAGQHSFELRARGFDFGGPQQLKVSAGGDYDVEIDMR
ncbi:MAG: serine/threonine protein kinase [Myxococcaceae bacterium]|nr:serine/threonine protein kinase [Myxococcaceae bacterium]